jgi:hypothetical protein
MHENQTGTFETTARKKIPSGNLGKGPSRKYVTLEGGRVVGMERIFWLETKMWTAPKI